MTAGLEDGDEFLTEDLFLGDKLTLLQPKSGYRAGIDAVLLAASANADGPVRILDLGAGIGTVGLCVAARLVEADVILAELQRKLVHLARRNIAINSFEDRVQAVEADITSPQGRIDSLALTPEDFAHVLANPPYHETGAGTLPENIVKATSHAMPRDALELWVKAMARYCAPGGRATMIHKVEALPHVLAAYDGRFGNIRIRPIYPRADAPAIRILVDGTKGSRAPLVLSPGLVLHGEGHAFTPEAEAILRHGAALTV